MSCACSRWASARASRSRDGEDLVIPNSVLIQTTVTNHTLKDSAYRIRVPVGVVYDSDMKLVKETLHGVAEKVSQTFAVPDTALQVIMTGFGSHSVDWEVAIWMDDPWRARPAISALHEAIWWAFRDRGIVIAFPQLDVHFDPKVAAGFGRLGEAVG